MTAADRDAQVTECCAEWRPPGDWTGVAWVVETADGRHYRLLGAYPDRAAADRAAAAHAGATVTAVRTFDRAGR